METGYNFSRSSKMTPESLPSPSSPDSSPSLTQSTSNSSSSPPQPTTPPPRHHARSRYLDSGRVPLHRRGKSQTYERLEDLLREAGYKETRIFTPESDKHGGIGDRDQESRLESGKQGVGAAVIGFLTGLVTGGNLTGTGIGTGGSTGGAAVSELRHDRDDNHHNQRLHFSRHQQPSPSPLAERHAQRNNSNGSRSEESSVPQTPLMTSSIESLNESTPKAYSRQYSYPSYALQQQQQQQSSRSPSRPTTPSSYFTHTPNQYQTPPTTSHQSHQLPQHPHHRLSAAQRQLQHQASRSSINTHAGPSNNINKNNNNNNNINAAAATVSHITNIDTGTRFSGVAGGGGGGGPIVNVIHSPRPSHAGNNLRRMVSAQTVIASSSRPNSTPPIHRQSIRSDDSDIEAGVVTPSRHPPPLPRNWLDNVARAILFGTAVSSPNDISNNATPNEPNPTNPPSTTTTSSHSQFFPSYQRPLRATRSSLSQTTIIRASKKASSATTRRSGLSDKTNTTIPPSSLQTLTPPILFTRLERGRASCSQSVLKAQVVCRSAPGSRAPSLVRQQQQQREVIRGNKVVGGGGGGSGSGGGSGRGRTNDNTRRQKKKPGDVDKTHVPSLARTRIEGDGWNESSPSSTPSHPPNAPRNPKRSPPPNSNGRKHLLYENKNSLSSEHDDEDDDGDDEGEGEEEEEEDDDGDDDGELDLAKMLVPPKRQNSIRSLRKHLHLQLALPSPTMTIDPSSSSAKLNPSASSSKSNFTPRLNNGNNFGAIQTSWLGGAVVHEEAPDGGTNEWEHGWRRGEFNSRRTSEDDEEVGALRSNTASRRSIIKTRLSLPALWKNANSR